MLPDKGGDTIRIDIHVHNHHTPQPDPRLDHIIELLEYNIQQEEDTMADLTALAAEVESNTSITASVVALVNRIADQLEAGGADQGAVDALVAQLRDNDSVLADLVVANTPAEEPPAEEPVPV